MVNNIIRQYWNDNTIWRSKVETKLPLGTESLARAPHPILPWSNILLFLLPNNSHYSYSFLYAWWRLRRKALWVRIVRQTGCYCLIKSSALMSNRQFTFLIFDKNLHTLRTGISSVYGKLVLLLQVRFFQTHSFASNFTGVRLEMW